jgi:hypothetical protein
MGVASSLSPPSTQVRAIMRAIVRAHVTQVRAIARAIVRAHRQHRIRAKIRIIAPAPNQPPHHT